MRISMECLDGRREPEVFRCCLGDVTIGVLASGELHEGLAAPRSKMADFFSDRPMTLRLNIVKPAPAATKQNRRQAKMLINALRGKTSQKNLSKTQNKALYLAAPRLELLLSDPAIHDRLKMLVLRDGKISFVPLESGFLFVNLGIGESILLLDDYHMNGLAGVSLCSPPVIITVVNGIMALLSFYLAENKGVIAHGTGINCRDEGYLFLAPSGGGKTTISMLSPPGAVLADDGVIVREVENQHKLYPTPFRQRPGGETIQWNWYQMPVPLKTLFILEKSFATRVRPVSRNQALGGLINGFTHFIKWMEPHQAIGVFDFWRRLSKKVLVSKLEFRQRTDLVQTINAFFYQKEKENENKEKGSSLAWGV